MAVCDIRDTSHLITCIVIIHPCPLTVGGKQFVSADIADMFTSFIFFWISPAFVFTSVIWFRQSYRYVFSPSLKVFPCGHPSAHSSCFRHGRRYKYGCSPVSVVQVHHTCILWFLQGLFYYCSHLTMWPATITAHSNLPSAKGWRYMSIFSQKIDTFPSRS